MDAVYFDSPAAFGAWLEEHHATETEVLVGFWKAATGRPSLTWSESVDEALRRLDRRRPPPGRRRRFTIRFTPRKARSKWSLVNVRKVAELTAQGRMRPAGVAAFEARRAEDTGVYSFERAADAPLDEAGEARFRAEPEAWEWFSAGAVLPQGRAALGGQREAPGDPRAAADPADHRLGGEAAVRPAAPPGT